MSSAERRGPRCGRGRRGFANPEPLLLLCAIALALAFIIPIVVRAREHAWNLKKLHELRAAVAAYQSSHGNNPPATIYEAAGGALDRPRLGKLHPRFDDGSTGPDTGAWGYEIGRVWINCTHTDSRGKAWAAY